VDILFYWAKHTYDIRIDDVTTVRQVGRSSHDSTYALHEWHALLYKNLPRAAAAEHAPQVITTHVPHTHSTSWPFDVPCMCSQASFTAESFDRIGLYSFPRGEVSSSPTSSIRLKLTRYSTDTASSRMYPTCLTTMESTRLSHTASAQGPLPLPLAQVWFDEIFAGTDSSMKLQCPLISATGVSMERPLQHSWPPEAIGGNSYNHPMSR
jgi:hypothetical protein